MNSRAPSGVLGHEHRRLDFDEALLLHRRADRRVGSGADAQVALHPLAADVEVAVLQPRRFGDGVGALVDRERRRLGGVEDLDVAILQFDPAGGQPVVDALRRSGGNGAGDAHDVLGAHVDGVVDDALGDAGVVAQVDERQLLAVLAAGRHPAAQADRLADVLGAKLAALVGAHGGRAHERAFFR